jgi:glycosyltransferase involved in cell wall biosynthesis
MSVEISVLTPSFGYGRFIRDAIESVLGQTEVRAEHVVQDGGSTDCTVAVLRSYGPALKWRSEQDEGQSDALNKALSISQGTWIAWLNADEFYLPDALSSLLTAAAESDADVVYGDTALVDESGRLIRLVPQHRFHPMILRLYGPFFSSCAFVARRDVLPTAPWHPLMRRVMDWDLYLDLAASGARFAHLRQSVAAFRVHADQVTALSADPGLIDYRLVRQRHGVRVGSRSRLMSGRILHRALKVQEGAYRRELAARHLAGRDIRWFQSDRASSAARELVERSSQSREVSRGDV